MSHDTPNKQTLSLPTAWLATRGAGTWAYGGSVAGLDLHDADLTDITVQDALAQGTNFRGAQLGRFKGVDGRFEGADFAGADLKESNFFNAKLVKAAFRGALMQGAAFATANLDEADLEDADLTGASLAGATLRGATLTNAVLAKADGSHAVFDAADLSGVDFSCAQLGKASFLAVELARAEARVLAPSALERVAGIHGAFTEKNRWHKSKQALTLRKEPEFSRSLVRRRVTPMGIEPMFPT